MVSFKCLAGVMLAGVKRSIFAIQDKPTTTPTTTENYASNVPDPTRRESLLLIDPKQTGNFYNCVATGFLPYILFLKDFIITNLKVMRK